MLRCINCHLRVDRMLRHLVSSLQSTLQTLLATWKSSQQLPPEDVICQECCLLLYQYCRDGNVNAKRDLGHTHVCIGCGRSVLETRRRVRYHTVEASDSLIATILSWDIHNEVLSKDAFVCHLCWMRANRHLSQNVLKGQPGTDEHTELLNQPVGPEQLPVPHQEIPELSPLAPTQDHQEDSTLFDHEIRVFCPKCKEEVKHTAEGIQEDQTKILVANVYHYFEQEYEELKAVYGDLDLTPLSKFRQRTALATGVSESRVLQILKDEEERNAEKRQEPPEERRRARKRSIQTDSLSEEDNSDDNASKNEQSSTSQDIETLVVKEEPAEYSNDEPEIYVPTAVKEEPGDEEVKKGQAQTDPISVDVKTEPQPDDNTTATDKDNANETLAETEPAGTKRKGRKAPRRGDVTSTRSTETVALTKPAGTKRKGRKISTSDVTFTRQQSPGEPSTAAASSSVQLAEELDESSLISDYEVKLEEMEIHEEGLS